MKDLHKPDYLDAKMELGTEVQFFSFDQSDLYLYTIILGIITIFFMFLIPNYWTEIFFLYLGSFVTMLLFYIKYGTN